MSDQITQRQTFTQTDGERTSTGLLTERWAHAGAGGFHTSVKPPNGDMLKPI